MVGHEKFIQILHQLFYGGKRPAHSNPILCILDCFPCYSVRYFSADLYGVVLLYTEGMAICEDDWENLWCAEMPEEFVTEGDGIEIDGLTPLEDLPMEQQVRIKNELAALPEEYLDVLRNYGGGEE